MRLRASLFSVPVDESLDDGEKLLLFLAGQAGDGG